MPLLVWLVLLLLLVLVLRLNNAPLWLLLLPRLADAALERAGVANGLLEVAGVFGGTLGMAGVPGTVTCCGMNPVSERDRR